MGTKPRCPRRKSLLSGSVLLTDRLSLATWQYSGILPGFVYSAALVAYVMAWCSRACLSLAGRGQWVWLRWTEASLERRRADRPGDVSSARTVMAGSCSS